MSEAQLSDQPGPWYHADRLARLSEGQLIDQTLWTDVEPTVLQRHLDELFPQGVTQHGENWLVKNQIIGPIQEPAIELLVEYVRRSSYPRSISRFNAVFAFATPEEARGFADGGAVWEVTSKHVERHDMKLLRLVGHSALVASWLAHLYWQRRTLAEALSLMGNAMSPQDAPAWEWLLAPPVRVVRRVASQMSVHPRQPKSEDAP